MNNIAATIPFNKGAPKTHLKGVWFLSNSIMNTPSVPIYLLSGNWISNQCSPSNPMEQSFVSINVWLWEAARAEKRMRPCGFVCMVRCKQAGMQQRMLDRVGSGIYYGPCYCNFSDRNLGTGGVVQSYSTIIHDRKDNTLLCYVHHNVKVVLVLNSGQQKWQNKHP
jgi:hypothetical protein